MTQETKSLWLKNICLYSFLLHTILTSISLKLLGNNHENIFMILLTIFFSLEAFKNLLNSIISIRNRWMPYYKEFPLFKLVRWTLVTIGLIAIMNNQHQLNDVFKWLAVLISIIIGFFSFDAIREIIEKFKLLKNSIKIKEIQNEFRDIVSSNTLLIGKTFDNINGYIDHNIHMYSVDKEDFYDDVYTGTTFGSRNSLNVVNYKGNIYKLDDIKSYLKEQNILFRNMKEEDWNVIDMMSIH